MSQTSRDAFATIANEAAYLAVAYPRLAESRRKSGHSLEWARQYAPADVKTELDRLLKEADACERCRKELVELSRMVRLRFSPETYAKLRLLPCPGPWHDQLGFDWQAAVAELRLVEATAVQAVNAEASGDGTGATPKAYCFGWGEILDAVGEKNTTETRRRLSRLNKLRQGPIVGSGRGTAPTAERVALVEWWNGLLLVHEAAENRRQGEQIESQAQHAYGRDGNAAPEIKGSVKRRRRDRRR
jgi:hypothetical protein